MYIYPDILICIKDRPNRVENAFLEINFFMFYISFAEKISIYNKHISGIFIWYYFCIALDNNINLL